MSRFSGSCQTSLKLDFGYLGEGRLEWEKATVRSGDTLQSVVFLQTDNTQHSGKTGAAQQKPLPSVPQSARPKVPFRAAGVY